MPLDFSDILLEIESSGEEFEETPVSIESFVEDKEYLGLPPLSELQYMMIRSMTQIYRHETLVSLYGKEDGEKRWKQTYNEIILKLGKGCHAPETPVFDPETGSWRRLSELKEGLAATMDGNKYATEAFKEGEGEMFEVETSLGFKELVYSGHKYFWLDKTKSVGEFKEVSKISVGDRVAIGLGMEPENPENMLSGEHAELIGYWLGVDTFLEDNKITFSAYEFENINRYLELCRSIGDGNPTRIEDENENTVSFRHDIKSKAIELAKDYDLGAVKIPAAVWKSNNNILNKTIEKIFHSNHLEFVSVSKDLAEDVHRALLRLGVPSKITSSSEEHRVSIGNKKSFIDEGIFWDEVISIKYVGIGEYWTRTVPENGHYFGNGFVSANSGKDYSSVIACAYVVHQLLCLKNPAAYYGKPDGDAIDIINIAVNAAQAKNVFFKGFKNRINHSPWFAGKYRSLSDSIEFDKSITVHSGHSEREAWEGFNLIFCVLDEISAFALENTSGNFQSKTSSEIYKMFRASVASRFPKSGKVCLLSFPRFKNDYISQKYDAAVAIKEVEYKRHKFKIREELPDGIEQNEFEIGWEEDHIQAYTQPNIFALCRPTWAVNPLIDIEDLKIDFLTDPTDALGRFACMPPEALDRYFPSRAQIEDTFSNMHLNIHEDGRIDDNFKPEEKEYYMHVDLAKKHDRCAVTMSHVSSWVNMSVGMKGDKKIIAPEITVDFIRYWTPTSEKMVDFAEVRNFILDIKRRGFNVRKVTFDRWNSIDLINQLRSYGIDAELLSVKMSHYDDFKLALMEGRINGPHIKLIIKELSQLQIKRGTVDHPSKGYKDLSDATVGSVFNSVKWTKRAVDIEIDVYDYTTTRPNVKDNEMPPGTIVAPKAPPGAEMPQDISGYLDRITLI